MDPLRFFLQSRRKICCDTSKSAETGEEADRFRDHLTRAGVVNEQSDCKGVSWDPKDKARVKHIELELRGIEPYLTFVGRSDRELEVLAEILDERGIAYRPSRFQPLELVAPEVSEPESLAVLSELLRRCPEVVTCDAQK